MVPTKIPVLNRLATRRPIRVEGETSSTSMVSSVIGGSYNVGYETVDEGRRLTRDGFFSSG